jgi:hypothetical protein
MKRKSFLFIVVTFVITTLSFVSCGEVETTEVGVDTMPGQITVCGYVRYRPIKSNGVMESDPIEVSAGTKVNIHYKVGESYHQIVVTTDNYGFFSKELGCTPNGKVDITVSSRIIEDTYARNEDGNWVSTEAVFFGQETKSISDGTGHAFNVILTQYAPKDEPGLK